MSDSDEGGKQIKMLYDRINRLELFDRAIILLWLESMRYDEIAAIVGLTPAAVTSRLFRIKEQLKSMSNN
jgi:RNA polymerase sigma-70 factor (ECF subfamily)